MINIVRSFKEIRLDIARAIKSLIPFNQVVMIAVPYDAFEAVRSEPDLGGRVWHLSVDPWSEEELAFIARSGFRALDVSIPGSLVGNLTKASFGAPFLMQQLCYDLCIFSGIEAGPLPGRTVDVPPDIPSFFSRIAKRTVPPVFNQLLAGPKQRGQERMERKFHDGTVTDLYGAILIALKRTGPKPVTPVQTITRHLARECDPAPSGQQISGSLGHMTEISNSNRGAGDPALVLKDDSVHILDPFLLFYLQWGAQFGSTK